MTAPDTDTPEPDDATDTAVEIATDVIGHHQFNISTLKCNCGRWSGNATAHPRHVAGRLATVGVLTTGSPA